MMNLRTLLVVLAVMALAVCLVLATGCGEKPQGDTGQASAPGEGAPDAAPAPDGPPAPGGPPGAPPGGAPMGGPPPGMGGPPGAPAAAPAGDPAALVSEAMAAKKQGNLATAEAKFREALQADPGSEDATWGLAWVLAEQGKKSEAVQKFRAVQDSTQDPTRRSEAAAAIQRLGG